MATQQRNPTPGVRGSMFIFSLSAFIYQRCPVLLPFRFVSIHAQDEAHIVYVPLVFMQIYST